MASKDVMRSALEQWRTVKRLANGYSDAFGSASTGTIRDASARSLRALHNGKHNGHSVEASAEEHPIVRAGLSFGSRDADEEEVDFDDCCTEEGSLRDLLANIADESNE